MDSHLDPFGRRSSLVERPPTLKAVLDCLGAQRADDPPTIPLIVSNSKLGGIVPEAAFDENMRPSWSEDTPWHSRSVTIQVVPTSLRLVYDDFPGYPTWEDYNPKYPSYELEGWLLGDFYPETVWVRVILRVQPYVQSDDMDHVEQAEVYLLDPQEASGILPTPGMSTWPRPSR